MHEVEDISVCLRDRLADSAGSVTISALGPKQRQQWLQQQVGF
jgi:hypothetical protein